MSEEYRVNVWYKTEVDFNIEAESEEAAKKIAEERAKEGFGTKSTPTSDEILSNRVVGVVDGNKIKPTPSE